MKENKPQQLSQLMAGCPCLDIRGPLEREITSLVYDSKKAEPQSLFIAIPGFQFDGSRFVSDAVKRGATAFVTETPLDQVEEANLKGITAINVENARRTLSFVSSLIYRHPSRNLDLVGITGTNGKTTVAYLLESVFDAHGRSTGVIGTINYRFGGKMLPASITTPESLELNQMMAEMLDLGVHNCVLEVSSHSLTLQRVRDLAFAVAVFTNLSRDHLDFHDVLEDYILSKKSLFTEHNVAKKVVNTDDLLGREIWQEAPKDTLTTAIHGQASVMAENIVLNERESRFDLKTPWGGRQIRSRLLGKHN
ncbi:MAG: UDP-N-acetylmuramyl-tripeptide synthetase, partial [Nitrospinota bacterium]|nr:UDP-N-acetylmuramyl-tripeptide synthetase [Nitrospinota bacterium]